MIDDIHVRNFLCVLKALHPRLPSSDHYELDRRQARGARSSSQQEHMVALPGNQDTLGSGIFTPQVANSSAKTTYNSLLHPAAFVWMAKALGENSVALQAAADAACDESDEKKRPGLLRKQLPWDRIAIPTKRHE